MTPDPLLSDDLSKLLTVFPNKVLSDLVDVLKNSKSFSLFPGPYAEKAHNLAKEADFRPHVAEIATEILWWGSNDLHRQFGEERGWRDIVARAASHIGADAVERDPSYHAWRIERAILRKALENWESLPPEQREAVLQKAGFDLTALKGGAFAAAAGLARLGGSELLGLLAARAGYGVAAVALPPVALGVGILGTLWSAYGLAGESYRVVRPVVMIIAHTRQRLRDERLARAFED